MKEDERLLLLLHMIRINGNIEYLLRSHYTLNELSIKMELLRTNDLICVNRTGIYLSKAGEVLFHQLNKKIGRRGLYKYFCIDSTACNPPMSQDVVYIPKRWKNENNIY